MSIKAWWLSFVERHIIADDPNPEYSRLDKLAGLPYAGITASPKRSKGAIMTDLIHDPEVPFVFRHSTGDKPLAKFRHRYDADAYAENYYCGHVTDTTPAPPKPTLQEQFAEFGLGEKFKSSTNTWSTYVKLTHREFVAVGTTKILDINNYKPHDEWEIEEI